MLDGVAGKLPMGTTVLQVYRDLEAAYNKIKAQLISWIPGAIPGAATATSAYNTVSGYVG